MAADASWLGDEILKNITRLAERPPIPVRQYEWRCHPDIFAEIRDLVAAKETASPPSIYGGVLGMFGSGAITEDPEAWPGGLRLYEDGVCVKAGLWRDGTLYLWDPRLAGW